jgi:hypothetical protein
MSADIRDPLKTMVRLLDAVVVAKGGTSIFACKPRGKLSAKAEKRLRNWAYETPHVSLTTPGPRPGGRPKDIQKPGRIVAGLTGKLGGYVSDLDEVV